MRFSPRSVRTLSIDLTSIGTVRLMRFNRVHAVQRWSEGKADAACPELCQSIRADKSTDAARVVELAEGEHSLDFLQAVYRDPMQPLSVRMRAAIEALPFEAPKLSAVAVSSMSGAAERLERAIARSGVNVSRTIDAKAVALPQPGDPTFDR